MKQRKEKEALHQKEAPSTWGDSVTSRDGKGGRVDYGWRSSPSLTQGLAASLLFSLSRDNGCNREQPAIKLVLV